MRPHRRLLQGGCPHRRGTARTNSSPLARRRRVPTGASWGWRGVVSAKSSAGRSGCRRAPTVAVGREDAASMARRAPTSLAALRHPPHTWVTVSTHFCVRLCVLVGSATPAARNTAARWVPRGAPIPHDGHTRFAMLGAMRRPRTQQLLILHFALCTVHSCMQVLVGNSAARAGAHAGPRGIHATCLCGLPDVRNTRGARRTAARQAAGQCPHKHSEEWWWFRPPTV